MNRLTIAIPTFRRPQDLKRAVSGVLEQAGELVDGPRVEACEPEGDTAGAADADGGAGRGVCDVEVLVIDNDARGTGRGGPPPPPPPPARGGLSPPPPPPRPPPPYRDNIGVKSA